MAKNWANKSDAYKQGYNDALNDYKNNQVGQKQNQPGQGQQQGQPQQGQGNQNGQQGQPQPGQGGSGMSNNGNGSGQPGQCSGGSGQGQQGQGQSSGNGGQSQSGNQGSSGQGSSGNSGDPQADYDQGYQDALNDIANNGGQGGNNMQSLSDFFDSMGISGDGQSPYKGTRSDTEGAKNDHRTDERDEADKKREVGQIKSGGSLSCGNSGSPYMIREVDRDVDLVDIEEHISQFLVGSEKHKRFCCRC